MARVLLKLRSQLAEVWRTFGERSYLYIAPLPPKDALPTQAKWTITRHDEHDVRAWLMFTPNHIKRSCYHVWAVFQDEVGEMYACDTGMQEMITRLRPNTRADVLARASGTEYVVEVRFKSGVRMRDQWDTTGVMSCVTLAKRVAGVEDNAIQTPLQLLAETWRKRDGRHQ